MISKIKENKKTRRGKREEGVTAHKGRVWHKALFIESDQLSSFFDEDESPNHENTVNLFIELGYLALIIQICFSDANNIRDQFEKINMDDILSLKEIKSYQKL